MDYCRNCKFVVILSDMADISETTWTVGRLLKWTTEWFEQKQVEGGRLAAELLLARALNCQKIELYTRFNDEPTESQRAEFRELIRQAAEHTPIAYLLGSREFYSLEFMVTPAVLIPRPETEAIVQRVIELCRSEPEHPWQILEVGTGSGCIAVAIARYAPNTRIIATDISADALAVAAQNAEKHEVQDRIRLIEADCASLTHDSIPEGGFDVVVSNPPYISQQQWPSLPPNVREHEPKHALLIENSDGLVMYRRFAAEIPAILKKGGRLLAEIGFDQHGAVLGIFEKAECWNYTGSHRNASDPYDRVVEFELQ